MAEKHSFIIKRKKLHATERRRQTFLPAPPQTFKSRKEIKDNQKQRRRVLIYLSTIPVSILTIITTIIISNIPQSNPTPTYTTATQLEADGQSFTGLKNIIDLGEPSPPGVTIKQQEPLIIDFIMENGTVIPVEIKYVDIRKTKPQETYLLNNIVQNIENQTIWLAKITATFNTTHSDQKPDITSTLIPESTANNIVAEIRISGWTECDIKTRTVTINNVEMHQQEHCMILLTEPDKTVRGIKYVGHYGERNNPYSVVDGKPITMLTPKNVIQ